MLESLQDWSRKSRIQPKVHFKHCQGCIYRGSQGSLGYPGIWGVIKAKAIKREIFEDFYLQGYPSFRKLNTVLFVIVVVSVRSQVAGV